MPEMNTDTFLIQNAILSFPTLFKPKPNDDGVLRYSACLIIALDTAQLMMNKAKELAPKRFVNGEMTLSRFSWPIMRCIESKHYNTNPRLKDLFYINASATEDYPPAILDKQRQPVIDRSQIYPGCVVAAGIRLFTFDKRGNVGVSTGVSAIMKTGDGDRLGDAGIDANDFFKEVKVDAPLNLDPLGLTNTAGPGQNMPDQPFPDTPDFLT